MKIKIISVSDSDKHFSSAIQEYCKRLGRDVDIVDIKPEKN
jgi:23S rRNA pseudoU1915 N3-methylase RlmH